MRDLVCKIPLLARALGLKAAMPSARATIGYLVYNEGPLISYVIKKSSFFTPLLCNHIKINLKQHKSGTYMKVREGRESGHDDVILFRGGFES